jgi:hypothetical protein
MVRGGMHPLQSTKSLDDDGWQTDRQTELQCLRHCCNHTTTTMMMMMPMADDGWWSWWSCSLAAHDERALPSPTHPTTVISCRCLLLLHFGCGIFLVFCWGPCSSFPGAFRFSSSPSTTLLLWRFSPILCFVSHLRYHPIFFFIFFFFCCCGIWISLWQE